MSWMGKAWVIKWQDDSRIVAESAEGIIRAFGQLQWEPVNEQQARALLADRCWIWSKVAIDDSLPDEDFLFALANAGMFTIEQSNPKTPN